jgi:glycosyltransferase involved in cell wall biosynthesis
MRIGINITGLVPEVVGGAANYARNLIRALNRFDSENEYYILMDNEALKASMAFGPGSKINLVFIPWLRSYIKGIAWLVLLRPTRFLRLVGWVLLNEPGLVWKLSLNMISQALFRRRYFEPDLREILLKMQSVLSGADIQELLRRISVINRLRLDLIHFPISVIPPIYIPLRIPFALTIHDIQQEFHPEFFDAREARFRKMTYQSGAGRADAIIAISEHGKQTLVEKYGIPPEKIVVTHQGCSELFSQRPDPDRLRAVKEKYGLPSRYLFYPAAMWPHKNHVQLFRALAVLRRKDSFEGSLVLTGNVFDRQAEIRSLLEELGLTDAVRFLEYIPTDDMPAIYGLAALLVFPSLFEGFGIPLVEAMSIGLPIVCSDRTSIPEVAGDAALYFNPDDPEDMAKKIGLVLEDETLRNRLVDRGRERVRSFTWQRTAELTVEAYRQARRSFHRPGSSGPDPADGISPA